ncbi:MAG TPA: PIN domain-containing protein [Thioploca sp.]|nr:PIN domain-containing protein [Thioploca sp.]
MSKLIKLYLETSAWNFYFADDAPEKQAATLQFFEQVKQGAYEIFISDIVFEEIAKASERKRELLFGLIAEYQPQKLEINETVLNLAEKYLAQDVLPTRAIADSKHAAVASVYELDALISWNLKHLANLRKMEKINGVNLIEGYSKRLELITPMEVSNNE